MKTTISSLVLLITTAVVFPATRTISNSGITFSPSSLTITVGDDIIFSLSSAHNAVEVSQATWDANGSTPLAGGFEVAFGGGNVAASFLTIGTHYYVCQAHVSSGMKGTIVVQNTTGIEDSRLPPGFSVYPNPTHSTITIEAEESSSGNKLYIADLAGRIVTTINPDHEKTTVDISSLAHGTYLIGQADRRKRSVKLIKL
jgi:plastocyanin